MTAGTDRVRTDAERRGIPIEIIERAPATSLEHAAELLGITPADIVKSLVVKRSDGSYLFAQATAKYRGQNCAPSSASTSCGCPKPTLPSMPPGMRGAPSLHSAAPPPGPSTPTNVWQENAYPWALGITGTPLGCLQMTSSVASTRSLPTSRPKREATNGPRRASERLSI